jgi:integrase
MEVFVYWTYGGLNMKARITAPQIKALKPSEKPYELVDKELKGFLARVQPSGTVSYYYSYRSMDGTRKRARIGTHPGLTAPAARKAAEKLAAQVGLGGDPHLEKKQARVRKQKAKHQTLGGFIELKYTEWALSHQSRGDETLILLKGNFEHLFHKKLADISAWDIQKWRTEKDKQGLAPSTVNRRVTTLKAVLNKAVEWDVIPANPLNKIKPLKIDKKSRVRFLSKDEESALRQALDDRESDIRRGRMSGNEWREVRGYKTLPAIDAIFADYLKPMVLLTLNTGLRRGEVFNLRWADIDFQHNQLTVEGTTAKSGQTRHIPLNSEAQAILKAWREQTNTEYVFASPVTRKRLDNIKRSWEALRARAGLSGFWFHDLRHTFASNLVMAGQDLYVIKELLGHSTIQMTERYAHLTPDHKINAVEKLVTQ